MKIQQDLAQIVSVGDLNAAILYYRNIVGVNNGFAPETMHEQLAVLICEKLKLSPTKVLELIELNGPLYPDGTDALNHLRLDLIERIVIYTVANTLSESSDLFDALLPLITYALPTNPQHNQFSWDLCAKAAECKNSSALEKIKRSQHWIPSYEVYVQIVQGDYSVFDTLKSGSWKSRSYSSPPGWDLFAFIFYEKCGQKCLELYHRPENVQLFDEVMRIYGPWHIVYNFGYLVNCVKDAETLKQLRFFLTRPAYANSICGTDNSDLIGDGDYNHSTLINHTSFAQLFVDKVKVGDHKYLNAFHSDFENIEALCFDNSTADGNDSGNPTKLDKLFPKGLLAADESLVRLLVRNIKFTLQSVDDANGEERLSRIRLVIDSFHSALLGAEVIIPLRQLALLYF